MYNNNETISKILNISGEIDQKCEMDKWYISLLGKTIGEIDVKDIYRMLRQDILMEIAVPKAFEMLQEDPLTGEMYDGQLLAMLYSVDVNKYKRSVDKVKGILEKINGNISTFEWMSDEDSKDYLDILEKILKKLK
ncbi:contact-dependent growth inhibition system immunity protein [Pectinatus frisingensis]|jgi:hypothetical protein|uniref:contact-dependent growth inhibition system immunity protein n=1 Tax=Pectinatus frisingensis TaxID=865 RepID=UPI0018C4D1A3|nr:contact-dependent growth inhibition system immunity protein [Pectinatus frisingensis]